MQPPQLQQRGHKNGADACTKSARGSAGSKPAKPTCTFGVHGRVEAGHMVHGDPFHFERLDGVAVLHKTCTCHTVHHPRL
jgi:hypothetical protein